MLNQSRLSHLHRLGIVLVGFFFLAGLVGWWAMPDSWNFDVDNWYRRDAVTLSASIPSAYGGNESCVECHAKVDKAFSALRHQGLSCESCHGALADHVRDDKKFAKAEVDKSRSQCLNCHEERINRPAGFPQFSRTGDIGKFVKKHKTLDAKTPCLKCHDAHDPTP